MKNMPSDLLRRIYLNQKKYKGDMFISKVQANIA
jgi:hypothetical protein